jgi:hypothetical protein
MEWATIPMKIAIQANCIKDSEDLVKLNTQDSACLLVKYLRASAGMDESDKLTPSQK